MRMLGVSSGSDENWQIWKTSVCFFSLTASSIFKAGILYRIGIMTWYSWINDMENLLQLVVNICVIAYWFKLCKTV